MAEIFRFSLICSENTQDNGRNKKLKCFSQLPLVTGSQRHMAEMFKETYNSVASQPYTRRFRISRLALVLEKMLIAQFLYQA